MFSHVTALESKYDGPQYPTLSECRLQTKVKSKEKLRHLNENSALTEISHDISAITEGDPSFPERGKSETTVQSSRTSKLSTKSSSGSRKTEKKRFNNSASSIETTKTKDEEQAEPVEKLYHQFVTLYCPVCTDAECILNKVGTCSLLKGSSDEKCEFCGENCSCNDNKKSYLPISGLVCRDPYGVPVTLLKENGGHVENSLEYVNRKRWCVPSTVRWDRQVNDWLTAYRVEREINQPGATKQKHAKRKSASHRRKMNDPASAVTDLFRKERPSEPALCEGKTKTEDMLLIVEGQGFKIYQKGREKILINFDRKNCKYLGCSCIKRSPTAHLSTCGCKDYTENEPHSNTKSRSKKKSSVSIVKETPDGYQEIEKAQILERNKNVSDISSAEGSACAKTPKSETMLRAPDVLHKSREEFLDSSLKMVNQGQ